MVIGIAIRGGFVNIELRLLTVNCPNELFTTRIAIFIFSLKLTIRDWT